MNSPPKPPEAGGIVSSLILKEVSSLDELERHIGLSRDDLIDELATGRLRGRRIGAKWLIHRDAIRTWLGAFPRSEAAHGR